MTNIVVTTESGYFTVTKTDATGTSTTQVLSFQDYILEFSALNMAGIDTAVAAMYDNTEYFSKTLEDISKAVQILNSVLGSFDKDSEIIGTNLTSGSVSSILGSKDPNAAKVWDDFMKVYGSQTSAKITNSTTDGSVSEWRAVLDNVSEFQTTISSKSDQWNTRTNDVVSSRGTAVELAKTLLGYVKDSMNSTVIR
ncbi:MAG: hypothetical protein ACRCV3_00655 [Desulfovibrionaceae bacterium]